MLSIHYILKILKNAFIFLPSFNSLIKKYGKSISVDKKLYLSLIKISNKIKIFGVLKVFLVI